MPGTLPVDSALSGKSRQFPSGNLNVHPSDATLGFTPMLHKKDGKRSAKPFEHWISTPLTRFSRNKPMEREHHS